MKNKKGISGEWKKIFDSWLLFDVPARPNDEVCLAFGKEIDTCIKNKKNPKVVILGSTPEFRDLCYKYYLADSAKIICIDISKNNFHAMTKLKSIPEMYERFIQSNWLDIPLADGIIDIVITDAAFSNIPVKDRHSFLKEVNRILKKEGLFISREDIILKKYTDMSLQQCTMAYAKKVRESKITLTKAVNSVGELSLRISASKLKGMTSQNIFSDEIYNLRKKLQKSTDLDNKLGLELLNFLNNTYFADKRKYWIIFPRKKLEKEFKSFFRIEKVIFNKTYDLAESLPIYVLKKRSI